MCGVPESMLTGEMARVSVEVFNVGQVALNSLRLTSSLGPHVLLDKVHVLVWPSNHIPAIFSSYFFV